MPSIVNNFCYYIDAPMMTILHDNEKDGWTVLMIAANLGHNDCVSILVSHGATVNASTKVRIPIPWN